jgi:ABC-type antimicrobial peptide transport system permease subunit
MFFIIPITIFNLLLHHTIDTNLSEIVINNEIKRAEDRIKNQEKSLSKEKGENVTWVRKDNKSDLEKISSTINNSLSIKGIIGKGLLYFILLILYSSIVSIFRNEDLKL